MDDRGDQPRSADDAGRWRQICLRFHDLRRGAHEFGLSDRFDALAKDPDSRLAEWLDLADQIQTRKERALGVAMPMIDLAAELSRQGIGYGGDRPPDYVCPDGRCIRQDKALFGKPPPCDLLGCEMIQAGGPPA